MGGHLREPWAATREGRSRGSSVDTADFQVTPRRLIRPVQARLAWPHAHTASIRVCPPLTAAPTASAECPELLLNQQPL